MALPTRFTWHRPYLSDLCPPGVFAPPPLFSRPQFLTHDPIPRIMIEVNFVVTRFVLPLFLRPQILTHHPIPRGMVDSDFVSPCFLTDFKQRAQTQKIGEQIVSHLYHC